MDSFFTSSVPGVSLLRRGWVCEVCGANNKIYSHSCSVVNREQYNPCTSVL
jgi:hypothetical protein